MAEEASAVAICQMALDQQPQLVAHFKHMVQAGTLAHAFLFAGPDGRGQLPLAKWLAMRLFCQHVDANGNPDGTCVDCVRIAKGEHPDVLELAPTGQRLKIDQIRQLRSEFTKKAVEGQQKVFIIRGADTMTTSAANSLLKFIEEPVGQQTAILLAENRQQLLPTIISRTEVIEFPRVAAQDFHQQVMDLGYSDEESYLVQALTDSLTEARNWLEDDWFASAVRAVTQLVTELLQGDLTAFTTVQTNIVPLASDRSRAKTLMAMVVQAWRDLLMQRLVPSQQQPHFVALTNQWAPLAEVVPTDVILTVLEQALSMQQRWQLNISFQATLEAFVLTSQLTLAENRK